MNAVGNSTVVGRGYSRLISDDIDLLCWRDVKGSFYKHGPIVSRVDLGIASSKVPHQSPNSRPAVQRLDTRSPRLTAIEVGAIQCFTPFVQTVNTTVDVAKESVLDHRIFRCRNPLGIPRKSDFLGL